MGGLRVRDLVDYSKSRLSIIVIDFQINLLIDRIHE